MNKSLFIRQGDILFEKVSELISKEDNNILDTKTVALGEITGHHHSFTPKDQVLLYGKSEPEMLVVVNDKEATLIHQEHKAITFPKGVYKIRKEQSYNPFLKQIQRSVD